MYVLANDITEALENLKKSLQGTMSDYTIASITETLILDVFHYVAPVPENLKPIEQPEMAYTVNG